MEELISRVLERRSPGSRGWSECLFDHSYLSGSMTGNGVWHQGHLLASCVGFFYFFILPKCGAHGTESKGEKYMTSGWPLDRI